MLDQLRPLCRSAENFESSWDRCGDHCGSSAGDLVPYSHSIDSYGSITTRPFVYHIRLCYSHRIFCIIIWHALFKSLYIYIRSIWPQMVVKHNRWSTGRRPWRDLRDAPVAGRCGEMTELEGRDATMNTPPHLSRHPDRNGDKEWFWLEERRKRVRIYDTTRPWGSAQLRGTTERASETQSLKR